MEDGPRVFEEGAVTLVLGPNGASLYAGTYKVTVFSSVQANVTEDGSIKLQIKFSKSHDSDVKLKIDENKRLFSSFPWAEVGS